MPIPTLVDSDTAFTETSISMTGTIDVSGSDRLAFVMVSWRNTGLETVDTITFGSDGLAKLGSIANSDDARVEIWYLKQPTTGTGITVTITLTDTGHQGASAWIGSFSGVDQTTPLGTYVSAVEDGVDPHNFTVTAETDDCLFANIQTEYGDSIVITSGNTATQLYKYDLGSCHSFFASKVSTAGDFDFSFDVGTSTNSAYNGVAIKGIRITYKLEGFTYDKNGDILASCECYLFKDNQDNTLIYVAYDESDGVTGAYSFTGIADNDAQYIVVAWKDNTPHVFDVTDHVLQPVV